MYENSPIISNQRIDIVLRKQVRPLTSKPPRKSIEIRQEKDGVFLPARQADLLPPIDSAPLLYKRLSRALSNDKENAFRLANNNIVSGIDPTPTSINRIDSITNKNRCQSNHQQQQSNQCNNRLAPSPASIGLNMKQPQKQFPPLPLNNNNNNNNYQRQQQISVSERKSEATKPSLFQDEEKENIQIQRINQLNGGRVISQPTIEQQQDNYRINIRQIPVQVQLPKKPRVPSVKRSQNPDLSVLDQAHPLIQTNDCFPILKKQISALPPSVTSKSWALFDGSSGKFIDGKCVHNQREVASLTKIMTCYTVLIFFEEYLLKDMKQVFVQVSSRAASITGTSARLKANMILSVWDLLFGLMLPSGNDSAFCLAESVGSIMYLFQDFETQHLLTDENLYDPKKLQSIFEQTNVSPSTGMNRFLYMMNQNAHQLDLINTNYANPHGLKNSFNKSSAYDVAKICASAMRIPSFKLIVTTRSHTANITNARSQDNSIEVSSEGESNSSLTTEEQQLVWENTNKLLEKGWAGIKTGVTEAAGPCLATCIKAKDPVNNVMRHLIIVILNAQTMDIRWEECQKLAAWAIGFSSLELQ